MKRVAKASGTMMFLPIDQYCFFTMDNQLKVCDSIFLF